MKVKDEKRKILNNDFFRQAEKVECRQAGEGDGQGSMTVFTYVFKWVCSKTIG